MGQRQFVLFGIAGVVAYTVRRTRPFRSSVRSVWVNIFWVMPSILRRSAPNRWGPCPSAPSSSTVHLSDTRSSARRDGQARR